MSNHGYSTHPGPIDGGRYVFTGPGMPQHSNVVWFSEAHSKYNADCVVRLLALAFEAGKAAAREEMRKALGL